MTVKGSTSHACAACKYQRRRCTPECALAQYFPADQPRKFQNAHRLFGVKKITKMLDALPPQQKSLAMQSIIYQANMRDLFPVDGCSGVIRHLTYQIWQKEEELQAVQSQVEMYRQHQVFGANVPPQELELGMAPPSVNASNENNANNNDTDNALLLFGYSSDQQHYNADNCQYSYTTSNIATTYVGCGSGFADNKENNNRINNHFGNNAVWGIHQNHQQEEAVQDYDHIHPFFDTIDDRQSYIDSKDAYDSSSQESLPIEHVADNELKDAAACFSLTNLN